MSKEIELKEAKCTRLSMLVPVQFKSEQEKYDFVMEAYTGESVERWWGRLAIAVDGIRAKKQIPIFRDHERANIIGFSTDTWKDASFWVGGKFSTSTAHAAEVKSLAKEGFPWQASIGVVPRKILALEKDVEHEVNGRKLKGPAEVWLESEVFETSFVPLGADSNTSVAVFSFEEAEQRNERTENMEKSVEPALTIESLRANHPEMVVVLLAEGAAAECARIKDVLAQSMPGHEVLVAQLAFDGKTTGPEAAVQVLAAEKKIRLSAAQNLKDDAVAPVAAPIPAEPVDISKLPVAERCKAAWDRDPELRAEFRDNFASFRAYEEAKEKGRFKVLGK
jgi:hypothetical protein